MQFLENNDRAQAIELIDVGPEVGEPSHLGGWFHDTAFHEPGLSLQEVPHGLFDVELYTRNHKNFVLVTFDSKQAKLEQIINFLVKHQFELGPESFEVQNTIRLVYPSVILVMTMFIFIFLVGRLVTSGLLIIFKPFWTAALLNQFFWGTQLILLVLVIFDGLRRKQVYNVFIAIIVFFLILLISHNNLF